MQRCVPRYELGCDPRALLPILSARLCDLREGRVHRDLVPVRTQGPSHAARWSRRRLKRENHSLLWRVPNHAFGSATLRPRKDAVPIRRQQRPRAKISADGDDTLNRVARIWKDDAGRLGLDGRSRQRLHAFDSIGGRGKVFRRVLPRFGILRFMGARPGRGFWFACVGTVVGTVWIAACFLDFPTLALTTDAGPGQSDGAVAVHDDAAVDAAVLVPFCAAGEVPPYCEDFDHDTFGMDGGPNQVAPGCALDRQTGVFLSYPKSMLANTFDASASDGHAFLGFFVALRKTQTFVVDAAYNIQSFDNAITPRTILTLAVPDKDSMSVVYQQDGFHVLVGATRIDPAAQGSLSEGWYVVELRARLLDGTFDLDVAGAHAIQNQKGITFAPVDGGASYDAGTTNVTLLFGAQRPMAEADTTIHVDNIRVTSN
jgi:hypothetical protein